MTKQEVYNNIQYNENLVRNYMRQIENLENQIADYTRRIAKLTNQRDDLQSELKKVEEEIRELSQLFKKFQKLQDDFNARQLRRKANLVKNFLVRPNVKFIGAYISGMEELLSGGEYRHAYNGVADAMEVVQKRKHTGQNHAGRLSEKIMAVLRDIDWTQQSINSCRAKIDATHLQISDVRGRISYWQQQLQYAT